ncbi:MAG: pilin [Francisellaceae bacterium]|nr:pilin [Francisellaceae bacterium]
MSTMKKLQGFTLIELVMVIILLGILAATALPKFANLTTQARVAAADGVAGGLAAAINIAHAQWLASSQATSITLEGTTTVKMSTTGWPECATCTPNGTATDAKCLEVWNTILNNPPQGGATTCTAPCQYLITGATSTCTFKDQLGGTGANSITYNISTGTVVAP